MDTLAMDLDDQGEVQVGRESPYPEEFRKEVVALYRAAGGKRTYAADLGITATYVRTWVRKENESQALPEHREAGGSPAGELAGLRAENTRLLKAEKGSGSRSARSGAGQPPVSPGR
ncbi:hypothetical protein GTY51_01110 [Streptomyces sp. SID4936]|nr:hypothetical protein [Streptomyces sp. SID4936]